MNLVERLDKWIFWCLCGYSFILCFESRLADQFAGFAVLLGCVRFIKEPIKVNLSFYNRAFFVFFSTMFLLVFTSPEIDVSLRAFWHTFNRTLPFFLIVIFIKRKRELGILLFVLLISIFINSLYAICLGIENINMGNQNIRMAGFKERDIIHFAGMLAMYIVITLTIFLSNSSELEMKYKYYAIFLFTIGFIALMFNGTRIVWAIAALLIVSIIFNQIKNKNKALIFVLLIAFGVIGFTYINPFMQQRIASYFDANNPSNKGHYLIARDSIKLIQDHPILGVGQGRFMKVFYTEGYIQQDTIVNEGKMIPHAHNNTLMILAESGIIGCIAFWFMMGSFLYWSYKKWRVEKDEISMAFFLITLSTILQGLTDYSFGLSSTTKMYFFIMGLYLCYTKIEIKHDKI
ncbi:O-antigen ligase family protein [Anaerosinus sp.]|uniref:O-antigen ligase family protein n=1 Tax=Selenobaculum sp. TaxID=3074374 RepID=UPI003AB8C5E8